jgi:hypothetical protein
MYRPEIFLSENLKESTICDIDQCFTACGSLCLIGNVSLLSMLTVNVFVQRSTP